MYRIAVSNILKLYIINWILIYVHASVHNRITKVGILLRKIVKLLYILLQKITNSHVILM